MKVNIKWQLVFEQKQDLQLDLSHDQIYIKGENMSIFISSVKVVSLKQEQSKDTTECTKMLFPVKKDMFFTH